MTARIHENRIKGIVIAILFFCLLLKSIGSSAQEYRQASELYKGFTGSFGTRSVTINSDIAKLDQSGSLQTGGQLGLIFGNTIIRSRLVLLGYYSSTANAAGSIDLYTSSASASFHPLTWIFKRSFRFEPYLTGGLNYDHFKFFGYYINREPGETNYSKATAPYLGKITQVNATIGIGIEFKLLDDYDFIHIFSEVRHGKNISTNAKHSAFDQTGIANQTQVMLGVSFGAFR